jgi:membrane peptidoglycan carboxypeptidase
VQYTLSLHDALPIYGFGLGSRFYFGKPLAELNPEQYALLIGIVKGPGFYDPRRFPERAQQRRDLVLRLMFEQHLLDKASYERALASPIRVIERGQYLNANFPAYMDAVRRELRQLSLDSRLLNSGIKVFTYLDPLAQTQAERTVGAREAQAQRRRRRAHANLKRAPAQMMLPQPDGELVPARRGRQVADRVRAVLVICDGHLCATGAAD